jgi:hypothetical protein
MGHPWTHGENRTERGAKMSEIKIEKGIPIPEMRLPVPVYPWKELEVGDSFLITTSSAKTGSGNYHQTKKDWEEKTGFKFVIRCYKGEGVRVWRTE